MRFRFAATPLFVAALVGCSGEDDGTGGRGTGVSQGAAAGSAGNTGLGVGGRAGRSGGGMGGSAGQSAAGTAGQGGSSAAGAGGIAGGSGAAGAGGVAGGSGAAGAGGIAGGSGAAGEAGAGGSAVFVPQFVCGNATKDPGELCDGGAKLDPCAAYLPGEPGVAVDASGVCKACFADTAACLTVRDGRVNGDETDVDCGGSSPTKCGLGLRCKVPSDCAATAGLRCLAGVCNRAVLVAVQDNPRMPTGETLTNSARLTTQLPLPADAVVSFSATEVAPNSVSVTFPNPNGLVPPAPLGRHADFIVKNVNLGPGQGTAFTIAATIGGPSTPTTITTASNMATNKQVTGASLASIRPGPCSATSDALSPSNGVIDIPVGARVCVTFAGLAQPVVAMRLGNAYGKLASGSSYDVLLDEDQRLLEGYPAEAPADVLVVVGQGEQFVLPRSVRFTALQFSDQGKPTGFGTPADPRSGTMADIAAATVTARHVQITGTFPLSESATIAGRIEGVGTAIIQHTAPGLTLTLGERGTLDNLVVSAEGLPPGATAPCVETNAATTPTLHGVEIKGCTTGLRARTSAVLVGGAFRQNGLSLDIGDPAATGGLPSVIADGTLFETAGLGIALGRGSAALHGVTMRDSNPAIAVSAESSLRLIGSTLENNGTALTTSGGDGSVVLADVAVAGNGSVEAIGLRAQGLATTTIDARNVRFDAVGKHAVLLQGDDRVDLSYGTITGSGNATDAAIEATGGKLRLLGGAVRGSLGTGLHVGANGVAGSEGDVSLLGGVELSGGVRGIVTDGAARLRLRDTRVISTGGPALVLGSTAAYDLDRTFLVAAFPRVTEPLLSILRPGGVVTGDNATGLRLQAGNGAEIVTGAGAVCGNVVDPAGGPYVSVAGGAIFCP